jgi:hypothetical protein
MQKALRNNISERFSWQAKRLAQADFEKAGLSMEIGPDSLSYAIFSSAREPVIVKSIGFKQFGQHNSINGFFEQEEVLQHGFSKVFISLQQVAYTLVPRAFYREADKEAFLEFNCGPKKGRIVLTDEIRQMDAKLVYEADAELKKTIDKLFPNHHTSALVSQLIDHPAPVQAAKETVFLHFRKDAIDLVLHRGSPVFCNSFAVLSPEDLLYFVLASCSQYGFDPASVQLMITGETETNSLAVKLLKKYMKHISFAVIDRQFKKPLEITGMASHYYYHLLNRIHCE